MVNRIFPKLKNSVKLFKLNIKRFNLFALRAPDRLDFFVKLLLLLSDKLNVLIKTLNNVVRCSDCGGNVEPLKVQRGENTVYFILALLWRKVCAPVAGLI